MKYISALYTIRVCAVNSIILGTNIGYDLISDEHFRMLYPKYRVFLVFY